MPSMEDPTGGSSYKPQPEPQGCTLNTTNTAFFHHIDDNTMLNVTPDHILHEHQLFDEMSERETSDSDSEDEYEEDDEEEEEQPQPQNHEQSPNPTHDSEEEDDNIDEEPPNKKRKSLSLVIPGLPEEPTLETIATTPPATLKKPSTKKKPNNVWTKPTSRKGKKRSKSNPIKKEDMVYITPVTRFPDRSDDSLEMSICLSKVYKAEKIELSDDRMSAGSCKGYRMVRATRGVVEGAWYFEIRVEKLGETGHTRLGWATEKGDLQAPVGYDGNSFGYRDVDGSKVHKAVREKYGDVGYGEGDVIGFYINLPDGGLYAPKPPCFVWYKGHKYKCAPDGKEELPKVIPGSQISFFKNGVCQGVAFKDLHGGCYYPAASMYTLPNQPNCVVKFNFGPDFEYFPQDFECRPLPKPMIEVPYLVSDDGTKNGVPDEKKS